MSAERWVAVAGLDDFQVSDSGSVRHGETELRGTVTAKGYRRFGLCIDGRRVWRYAHVLVLEAFVGPRPAGQEACHGNGDGLDNRLTNLRWDTHESNMADQREHGTHPNGSKTHCPQGHAYDEENTYYGRAARICRACRREWMRDRRASEQEKENGRG